jgi:hypothetical protein
VLYELPNGETGCWPALFGLVFQTPTVPTQRRYAAAPEAMLPHLFSDHRPPPVLVAALGDLAGAIGASLLSPPAPPAAG